MKRTMIASAIALAFGFTTPAMANPTNTLEDRNEDISQTATAQSTLDGKGASANEYSSATFNDNSTDTRTKTLSTDNSDNSTTNACGPSTITPAKSRPGTRGKVV